MSHRAALCFSVTAGQPLKIHEMKKIIMAAAFVLSLMFANIADSSAQLRFGVTGGATFSKLSKQTLNAENMTQYHAGVTMQVKLPLGFSIQPSLIYNVKGSRFGVSEAAATSAGSADLTVGYLELPVSIQWGPDLLLFRPFLDVTPFVGYGLNNKLTFDNAAASIKNSWSSSGINRWEYGLGLGVGLEIWKFQVIGRYNWNLGSISDLKADLSDSFGTAVRNSFSRGRFGGFTLTAAFLF